VGYSEEEPDQLLANPSNWRIHPAAQQNALSGVLKEIGLVQNVVANRTTGHLVDGHLRVMLAMRENQPVVPVTWVELSEEEEHLILASLDPLAAMATADAGALNALLSSVQSGEAAVTAMLAELAEGAGLYQPQDDPQDADPQIDRAEELREKWGVESGQLWRLPSRTPGQEHRLICGDCTDAAVVERVGIEAHMPLFTDPPYGINHDPAWLDGVFPRRQALSSRDVIANDDGSLDLSFLTQHPRRMVWGFPYLYDPDATGWVVWDKQPGLEGRGIVTPIEMAYTNMRKGFDMVRVMWGGYYRASGEDKQPHPTQKPISVYQPFIDSWTKPGDVLADYFCGSAPVIIAAENLSRQCRAVEISPGYVAVALERYATAFGIEPELIT